MNHPDDAIDHPQCRCSADPVVPEGVRAALDAAKGCHGCRFAFGLTCTAPMEGSGVQTWQAQHLSPDLLTPKPSAPECPGRVER